MFRGTRSSVDDFIMNVAKPLRPTIKVGCNDKITPLKDNIILMGNGCNSPHDEENYLNRIVSIYEGLRTKGELQKILALDISELFSVYSIAESHWREPDKSNYGKIASCFESLIVGLIFKTHKIGIDLLNNDIETYNNSVSFFTYSTFADFLNDTYKNDCDFSKNDFSGCLSPNVNKEKTIKKITDLIKGLKGKEVALIIRALMDANVIIKKPTYKQMNYQFGDIGHRSGYDAYMNKTDPEAKESYTKVFKENYCNYFK